MAILTLDQWIASTKHKIVNQKTTTFTTVANQPFGMIQIAGNPGAGTLAVGNTANGLVHNDSVAGYPPIPSFGGLKGYFAKVAAHNTVLCNLQLFDCLFAAGAYVFNADVTLATQPSYSARVPGLDYSGLELWIEAVTSFTGNQTIQINYLDQDGNVGDTGAIPTGVAPIVNRMRQINLASGDSGIQQITRVRSSVSTIGTFNVYVLRPLWECRIPVANAVVVQDMLATGMIEIFDTSALKLIVGADSTSSGQLYTKVDLAIG